MILDEKSIRRINRMLSLPVTGHEQDWDLEMSDPTRLSEFIALYRRAGDNFEVRDKQALMALILASCQEAIQRDSIAPSVAMEIRVLLEQDFEIHRELISYWTEYFENDRRIGNILPT